jgi:F420-non-reducing hydrogenase iron-sulfur subunit
MRLQYPSDVRIIQVPCTGKVDIIHLLQAFEAGADGVFVAGCLEGDCHFMEGNLFAKKRVKRAKEILDKVGLDGGRVEMFNLSAGMGGRFAEIVKEMDERVRALGPSPIRGAKGAAPRPTREVTA